jgi:hypothetical protein
MSYVCGGWLLSLQIAKLQNYPIAKFLSITPVTFP